MITFWTAQPTTVSLIWKIIMPTVLSKELTQEMSMETALPLNYRVYVRRVLIDASVLILVEFISYLTVHQNGTGSIIPRVELHLVTISLQYRR